MEVEECPITKNEDNIRTVKREDSGLHSSSSEEEFIVISEDEVSNQTEMEPLFDFRGSEFDMKPWASALSAPLPDSSDEDDDFCFTLQKNEGDLKESDSLVSDGLSGSDCSLNILSKVLPAANFCMNVVGHAGEIISR
ncbi:hypothetical protein AB6A40_001276 [Gnathostoma spinigerum]|uniref:Uncharacterized protein n=1 Tax=Gnathostoma spinigerum TaxID=75299 RepID=A0ABD6ED05_9BILA